MKNLHRLVLLTLILTIVAGCSGGGSGGGLNETEPNNAWGQAQAVSMPITGLSGSVSDQTDAQDYFQVELTAGQVITVSFVYTNSSAQTGIYILNDFGGLAGSALSASVPGGTTLDFSYVVYITGTYCLMVESFSGETAYNLVATVADHPICEIEPNDSATPTGSQLITMNTISLTGGVDQTDLVDIFRIEQPGSGTFTTTIDFDDRNGDVGIAILDSTGTLVEESSTVDNQKTIVVSVVPDGTYYIRVSADVGNATYQLKVFNT